MSEQTATSPLGLPDRPDIPSPEGVTGPRRSPVPVAAMSGEAASMEYYMRKTSADTEAASQHKSSGVAFALCFFLGTFGVHRFYLGRKGSATTMLVMGLLGWATLIILVGLALLIPVGIWAFIDLFLVSGIARQENNRITREVRARHGITV